MYKNWLLITRCRKHPFIPATNFCIDWSCAACFGWFRLNLLETSTLDLVGSCVRCCFAFESVFTIRDADRRWIQKRWATNHFGNFFERKKILGVHYGSTHCNIKCTEFTILLMFVMRAFGWKLNLYSVDQCKIRTICRVKGNKICI